MFQFHQFNKLVRVFCDDIIPVAQADRINESNGHWWAVLVEKGYAKFCGSYENIDGGFPRHSLYHLTGGICVDIELYQLTNQESTGLFQLLLGLMETDLIVLNAGNKGNEFNTRETERGILTYHAYSILQLKKIQNNRNTSIQLVQLRNPHGNKGLEWNGDWSDRSALWNTISRRTK